MPRRCTALSLSGRLRFGSCRNAWYSRFALQLLLENDAPDLGVHVFLSETGFLLAVRRVEIRIVVDLAGATDAGVERLRRPVVPLQGVGIEQVTARLRQGEATLVVWLRGRGEPQTGARHVELESQRYVGTSTGQRVA
jgi:hypothetical protein